MRRRFPGLASASVLAATLALMATAPTARADEAAARITGDGIVKVMSAYAFTETIDRLKADITAKKIKYFLTVDQARLAADAGIALKPSTLLMFGNPPLGTQFITSRAEAGLDWPVRLLVSETARGEVQVSYTDFQWIARRHAITDRDAQFKMASEVIRSITASIAGPRRAESPN